MTGPAARDARPPRAMVRLMNPVMSIVLRTPLGRAVRPFALLEFRGRRSGKLRRITVGFYEVDSGSVVFTPAAWRANFREGLPVAVWFHGRRREFTGLLDDDPERVTLALRSLAEQRGSLRLVGIGLPAGQQVCAADVVALDRAVIHFEPASSV